MGLTALGFKSLEFRIWGVGSGLVFEGFTDFGSEDEKGSRSLIADMRDLFMGFRFAGSLLYSEAHSHLGMVYVAIHRLHPLAWFGCL